MTAIETRRITVADLFCGAGGSSTGAQIALTKLGLSMDLVCVNHWNVAIETHTANHPKARHYCQDRMLEPHELAAAMGFDAGEVAYEFAGTKTDKIRQIGNAVPVRLAAALVGALMGGA